MITRIVILRTDSATKVKAIFYKVLSNQGRKEKVEVYITDIYKSSVEEMNNWILYGLLPKDVKDLL